MLTIAVESFANGILTITPEEPTTLQLMLAGLGTMAIYALWTSWRPLRMRGHQLDQAGDEQRREILRRAA